MKSLTDKLRNPNLLVCAALAMLIGVTDYPALIDLNHRPDAVVESDPMSLTSNAHEQSLQTVADYNSALARVAHREVRK
jgi:hypothetical protein